MVQRSQTAVFLQHCQLGQRLILRPVLLVEHQVHRSQLRAILSLQLIQRAQERARLIFVFLQHSHRSVIQRALERMEMSEYP